MITQITDAREFERLAQKGIEAQKIRALFLAYGTGYDFCRFYRQGDSFLSLLDGAAVLCDDNGADIDEWSGFIMMQGCREVFCSAKTGEKLAELCDMRLSYVNVMRYTGGSCSVPQVECAPSLSDVYSIIRDGFEIEFESWYLDMSHRVRHGITQCRTLDNDTALVIQHDLNGEALISQVATRISCRGEGKATQLVRAVSAELLPSDVYIICEDKLTGFYEKCGYVLCDKKCILF